MAAAVAPPPRRSMASAPVEATEVSEPPPAQPASAGATPDEAAAGGVAAERNSISAAGGTPPPAAAAAAATLAAQRRLSATESALAASRRPLFLTYSLFCASDAAALLQQKDPVRLARQLDEILQLHQLVLQLRQPPRRASLPGLFSTSSNSSSSSSNSSSTDFTAQLESAEDSYGIKDTAAVSCSSSNSSSVLAGTGRTILGEECRGEEALETGGQSAGDGSHTAVAAGAPNTPEAATTISQQQQQQLQQMQQEEEAIAAAHLVVVEYFVAAVTFCRSNGFTPRAVSAFLALLHKVYTQSIQQQLSPAAAFEAFKALLLQHAVHRPPRSTAVFSPDHLLPATDFFLQHFVRLLPHLQQLHAPQQQQQPQHLQ
ncbi:hypothetical protein, conserved [Eimeria praecox]|uniref:Uncharacterized protein n=1 Tax=Eimeria praecox TaxID=51316 RepID=U6GXR0_9EIME|nr:hypothetical protein, conserved [Eimeria praecox]